MMNHLVGPLKLTSLPIVVLIALIVQIPPANALDLDVRSNRSNILDFSLQIEHSKIDFENTALNLTSNLERIGIISIDVPSKGPHFGLLLGYAFTDFSQNSSYETLGMDGYYIGVSVRGYLPIRDALSLSLHGHYVYQSVDGKDDQRSASLSWDEFSATALLEYSINDIGIIFVGANAGVIEARYRESGTANSSVDLDNENDEGAIVGFSYEINRLEHFSISYQQAVKKGVLLRFRKLF